jgi:hypothetical protein
MNNNRSHHDPIFSAEIVRTLSENLNLNKSVGPDGVHPKVLRECSASIAEPLALIFDKPYVLGDDPNYGHVPT